jgi:hypothetical protein
VHTSTQALVAEVFDAMNTRQLEKIRDLVTDDFVDHGFPVPLPPARKATSGSSSLSPRCFR